MRSSCACFLTLLSAAFLSASGCSTLGPDSVVRDRIAYNDAIARSAQQQNLLNIVRLRYLDAPMFLDVSAVVSGYQMEQTATANVGVASAFFPTGDLGNRMLGNLFFGGRYTDRPTISYTPLDKAGFIRNFSTPIPPSSVLFLIQSGYPADVVLGLMVDSINGLRNRSITGLQTRPADPEFERFLAILRKAQIAGAVAMRVERNKGEDSTVLLIRDENIDPELAAELNEARKLLGLDETERDIKVVFGARASSPKELAILSRSALRVFGELSAYVQVPAADLAKGSTPDIGFTNDDRPPLRVLSGCELPCDAFAAVSYRGQWFWIDDRDLKSKRAFAFMMLLFTLAETGEKEPLPLITIPAQ